MKVYLPRNADDSFKECGRKILIGLLHKALFSFTPPSVTGIPDLNASVCPTADEYNVHDFTTYSLLQRIQSNENFAPLPENAGLDGNQLSWQYTERLFTTAEGFGAKLLFTG